MVTFKLSSDICFVVVVFCATTIKTIKFGVCYSSSNYSLIVVVIIVVVCFTSRSDPAFIGYPSGGYTHRKWIMHIWFFLYMYTITVHTRIRSRMFEWNGEIGVKGKVEKEEKRRPIKSERKVSRMCSMCVRKRWRFIEREYEWRD